MNNSEINRKESKAERTDRIAREIIQAERSRCNKKSAWLRDMRLKAQRIATV